MIEVLLLSHVEGLVSQAFEAYLDGSTYPLILERVEPRRVVEFEGRVRDPFMLFFRGPGPMLLQQGTYPVGNVQMGQTLMFLVPVRQEKDSFIYQATYS